MAQAKIVLKGSTIQSSKNIQESLQTGIVEKKVLISTRKLYIFESPHIDSAST